jgi:hypothetical protein
METREKRFEEGAMIARLYHDIIVHAEFPGDLLTKYPDGEAEKLEEIIGNYRNLVPAELRQLYGLDPLLRRLETEIALVRFMRGNTDKASTPAIEYPL